MKLLDAVNLVKNCVSNDDVVQILSHICLDDNKIIAYNGAQAIIVKTDDIDDISCAVPGTTLIKILNSLPVNEVKISQEDDILNITCAKTKTKVNLSTLPRKQFIFKEEDISDKINKDYYLVVNEEFISGLTRCIDTISDNRTKIEENGITIIAKGESMVLYSTDRVQLSSYVITENVTYNGVFMIPQTFCQMLLELKSIVLGRKMFIANDCLMIVSKEVTLFSHLISDISYLPYRQVITDNVSDDIVLFRVPKKLSDSLTRCMLVATATDKRVGITTSSRNNFIELSGDSLLGNIRERVIIKQTLKDGTFTVNGDFLNNMLPHVTEIAFNTRGKNSTVIVGISENSSFTRIISSIPTEEKGE